MCLGLNSNPCSVCEHIQALLEDEITFERGRICLELKPKFQPRFCTRGRNSASESFLHSKLDGNSRVEAAPPDLDGLEVASQMLTAELPSPTATTAARCTTPRATACAAGLGGRQNSLMRARGLGGRLARLSNALSTIEFSAENGRFGVDFTDFGRFSPEHSDEKR